MKGSRRLLASALALFAIGAAAPAALQQGVTFRAGVDLLTLDFYALDPSGAPVVDLTARDIQLKVNGRARPLRALELIRVGPAPAAPTADLAATPADRPYSTNAVIAGSPDRSIILAVENESLRPGREGLLRASVDRFLSGLAPRDRVAVATMPYGGIELDFTTDRERVRRVIAGITGRAAQSQTSIEAACQTRRTLDALAGLLESLSDGAGPVTVLFFSTGMMGPRRDTVINLPPGIAPAIARMPACELTTHYYDLVGAAASAARAHFFVVQPDDFGLSASQADNPLIGLESLAGVTGATRLNLQTADDPLLRVVRGTSAYYMAGFEVDPAERNGLTLSVSLDVSRRGVTIRTRPRITMTRAGTPPARAVVITPKDMLRDSRAYRDLPLRSGAFSSRDAATGAMKIVAVADSPDAGVALTAASVALFDANGRLTAEWTATPADLGGPVLAAALPAASGTYRLRVAATDALGRTGTVDDQVVAELTPAGPLRLSSLVLGLHRNNAFSPRLEFSSEPVVIGFVEIYGGMRGAPIVALLELSLTPNGSAFLNVPLALTPTATSDRFIGTGAIPIGALPNGDYVVRAIVGMQGQPETRVLRTLRKAAPRG